MIDYWRQDTSLKAMNLLFTAGSCGLSGYCGWLLASDLPYLVQIVTACIFGGIAYGLSEAIIWRTRYRIARDRDGYVRNTKLALFLLLANLATDYSASSTLRDLAKTNTEVQNTNATLALTEVKRIETRQAEIRKQTAWQTKYLAPEAYDGMIAAQRHAVDLEGSKGGCRDRCQAEKQKLASLQADQANAQQRTALVAEMKRLDEELVSAKAAVKETPKVGNPALAPIIGLVSWAKLSLTHKSSDVQWGLNSFVLMLTAVITAAIWYLSTEIGSRLGAMTPADPIVRRPAKQNFWLEAPEGHEPNPIPLQAQDVPRATSSKTSNITVNYTGKSNPRTDALMAMIAEFEQKASA